MKHIGMTKGGTMIVELNLAEAKALQELGKELAAGTLEIVPSPVPDEIVYDGGRSVGIHRKSRTRRIKADKSGSKQPISPEGLRRPGKPAKVAKVCVICGKPTKSAQKNTCSKVCLLAKYRATANASYARKHPGAKARADRKTPPAAVNQVDRLDLIRQANDRVNKMHEEEA